MHAVLHARRLSVIHSRAVDTPSIVCRNEGFDVHRVGQGGLHDRKLIVDFILCVGVDDDPALLCVRDAEFNCGNPLSPGICRDAICQISMLVRGICTSRLMSCASQYFASLKNATSVCSTNGIMPVAG